MADQPEMWLEKEKENACSKALFYICGVAHMEHTVQGCRSYFGSKFSAQFFPWIILSQHSGADKSPRPRKYVQTSVLFCSMKNLMVHLI